ncbi:MAG: 30S ribosome-binding factor RbfA [bacterium]|nr:30S ribosome-binding factor RbfA [bacterium]
MTQKKTYRIHQINRQLREEIASILLMEMQDEMLKDVTITEVRTSKDLHHALVFTATHKNTDREHALESLNKAAGYIRRLLFGRLRLRHIPELDFRYDESLDRAERIFTQINRLDIPPAEEDEEDEA